MHEILKEVKRRLADNQSADQIKVELTNSGYLEADVVKVVEKLSGDKDVNKRLIFKEIFDRAGYGLGSLQFINILFAQTGASMFLIGVSNGLRSVFGTGLSSLLKQFSEDHSVGNFWIGFAAFIYGLAFSIMAFARSMRHVWLFFGALLLGSAGVVFYGEFFNKMIFKFESKKTRLVIDKLSHFGIIITGVMLLIGALTIQKDPRIDLGFITLRGYSIALISATLCFFISAVLTVTHQKKSTTLKTAKKFVESYISRVFRESKDFFGDYKVILLILASTLTTLVQIMGSSYYGIYIYESFMNIGFGGFVNVAMIFLLALLASLIAPNITKNNVQLYGSFPMLIFGTMLMAIMPLTYYFNPNLVSIAMGTIAGVTGSAISGIARGFIASKIVKKELKKSYFELHSIISLIPLIFLVPLGSYLAQNSLEKLFLYSGLVLVFVVAPIYIILLTKDAS